MFVYINLKYFTHLSKMVFMKMKKRISSQIFHCFFIVKSRKCGVFLGLVFGSRTVPFHFSESGLVPHPSPSPYFLSFSAASSCKIIPKLFSPVCHPNPSYSLLFFFWTIAKMTFLQDFLYLNDVTGYHAQIISVPNKWKYLLAQIRDTFL